jgi:hypothetical protein
MLYYGTIQGLNTTENCIVYNFTSLNETYPRLKLYPPENFNNNVYDYEFDYMYANYIIYNDNVFFDFMMIIYNLYQGKDVFILVDDNLIDLNESLFKFIQQRYGYNACRINNLEDLIYAENTDFSREGLCNLDIDKERLSYMLETERLKSGGKPYELI